MRQVWLGLRETVVVGDLVVMMDTVVSLVVHLVVTALPHLVSHHLVLVVIEMVFEKDNKKNIITMMMMMMMITIIINIIIITTIIIIIIIRWKAGIRRVRIIRHRYIWWMW